MAHFMKDELGAPKIVDRTAFQAELDALRIREKAHTREGDAIAAARRRLPMVEVDPATKLTGPHGPVTLLDAFEGRRQLIAYYFMCAHRPPSAGAVRGMHVGYNPGPGAVISSLSRCHLRRVLPGTVRSEPSLPRFYGLGGALVLGPGLTRHTLDWTPSGEDARRLLSPARIQSLRDILDHCAGCRGHG